MNPRRLQRSSPSGCREPKEVWLGPAQVNAAMNLPARSVQNQTHMRRTSRIHRSKVRVRTFGHRGSDLPPQGRRWAED